MSNNKQIEQIKQFLYGEICERREYSASRMCEEVLKFIEQMSNEQDVERVRVIGDKIIIIPSSGNVGIGPNVRWRGDNNIPDTDNNTTGENNNTSTTGNSSTTWGKTTMHGCFGDTSSTTGNSSTTWGGYRLNVTGTKEDDDRIKAEKQIWDKTVNWDIRNKYTRVADEEQAPYNVKTNVVTSGKTDDGTLAVIEITIDIKQR